MVTTAAALLLVPVLLLTAQKYGVTEGLVWIGVLNVALVAPGMATGAGAPGVGSPVNHWKLGLGSGVTTLRLAEVFPAAMEPVKDWGWVVMTGMVAGGPVTAPTALFKASALAWVLAATAVMALVNGTRAASDAGRLLMSAIAARTAEVSLAEAVWRLATDAWRSERTDIVCSCCCLRCLSSCRT